MSAQFTLKYNVIWSEPISIWRSSFKYALFAYGLQKEDIYVDDEQDFVLTKESLESIYNKLEYEKDDYQITENMKVKKLKHQLDQIINNTQEDVVRIRWDVGIR